MKTTKINVILAVILGCVQSIGTLGCAWLLTVVVQMITGDSKMKFEKFCVIAFGYYVAYVFIYYMSKKQYYHVIQKIRTKLKERLLAGLIWNSEENHELHTKGHVISFFQNYVDLLETAYLDPVFSVIKNISLLVFSIATVATMQWQMAMGMVLSLGIYLYLVRGIQARLTKIQNESVAAQVEEKEQLVTMIQSYYTAKDYGKEDYFIEKYEKSAWNASQKSCQCNIGYNMLQIVNSNMETVFVLFTLLCGSWMIQKKIGVMTVGELFGMTQFLAAMIHPVGSMGTMISKMKSTKDVRKELDEYIYTGENGKKEWVESSGGSLPKLEKIVLQNVSFSYSGKDVLKHVSATFYAGKKYAIVGASGEGKTTLLKVLLKQLLPDEGEIFWNQYPYSKIGKGDLICKFCYVAQNPMLFCKSVEENIIGGMRGEQKDILNDVMRRSGVEAIRGNLRLEEIQKLQATELSGGEKKRVAYARALYKEGEVLLLDEVTSGLDKVMAQQLEKDMIRASKQMVIHVTHQLSSERMEEYDEVFCVENGQVFSMKC